jgi:hypothetical protein
MHYRNIMVAIFAITLMSACAAGSPQKLQTDDPRECAKNFTYDGNFLLGRTFKTNQFVAGVSKNVAMERSAKKIAKEGMSITSIDKDIGIISASQTVSYGAGKTAPLTVSVDSAKSGVDVSISFSISGGTTTPTDTVKDFFCSIISAIAGN